MSLDPTKQTLGADNMTKGVEDGTNENPSQSGESHHQSSGATEPPALDSSVEKKDEKGKRITKADLQYLHTIGYGSYSKVVLAVHKVTMVKYAVKIVSKMQLINEDKHRCAMRERDTLRILSHPNIIKLVSTFQTPDELHYVMEYAENGELLDHIKKVGRFEYHIAKRVTAELVSALEYLHSKKVIHRDLKPENLLFDKHFHVKMVDFGTAIISNEAPRPLEDIRRLSTEEEQEMLDSDSPEVCNHRSSKTREHAKSFCGTAQYASPELLRNCTTTYSSDLWALGCIVYQMVTGKRPFQDPSDYLTFKRISERDIHYPPDFPPVVRDLCDKLLVLNPCERLGVGPDGYAQLRAHPFFEGIDFTTISLEPPNFNWRSCAPEWVPDHEVDKCQDCQTPFSFFLRKHHCRACGNIFCAQCSSTRIEIPHIYDHQPMRVCKQCYATMKRQADANRMVQQMDDF
eukprot:GGOE01005665.1.p1 GENE.GGOE01005665.1~~GGOE01005665.1.p1  ORF type:complete len:459 (+),score=93.32 GGOE01005665.1:52-1428(+)